MDQSARLLDLIRAHRTTKIGEQDLLDYFDECFPEFRHSPDREARCRKELDRFQGHAITLCAAALKKGREAAMPHFVRKVNAPKPGEPVKPPDDWLPDLAQLAADLRRRQARLDDLRQINNFLKNQAGPLAAIPYRERSLQIFGDEKRIGDVLRVDGGTLFDGRLPLARIGAYDPPLPFVFAMPEPPCPNAPVLVVENHHSFASFVAANDHRPTFAAIVWGNGKALTKGCAEYLDTILRRAKATALLYVGDIDPSGILIPHDADRARRQTGLPPIEPARELYRWLLANGTRRPICDEIPELACEAAITWLGKEVGQDVLDLWGKGWWVPQEALHYNAIMTNVIVV